MVIDTRKRLEADLDELKRMVFLMGRMSGSALSRAVAALKDRNVEEAQKVIASDDLIDELEEKIDNCCMEFAARYQPLGEDLRAVTSIMHIAVTWSASATTGAISPRWRSTRRIASR